MQIKVYTDEMYPVYYQSENDFYSHTAEVDEEEFKQFEDAMSKFHHWQNWLEDKCVKVEKEKSGWNVS